MVETRCLGEDATPAFVGRDAIGVVPLVMCAIELGVGAEREKGCFGGVGEFVEFGQDLVCAMGLGDGEEWWFAEDAGTSGDVRYGVGTHSFRARFPDFVQLGVCGGEL